MLHCVSGQSAADECFHVLNTKLHCLIIKFYMSGSFSLLLSSRGPTGRCQHGCASSLQLSVVLIFNWLKMLKSTWAADGHCGDSCFDMPFCMVQVETWQQAPLTVSFCSCLLLLSSTSLTSFPVPASHSCSAAPKHFRYRKCPSGRNCMPSWASFSCL